MNDTFRCLKRVGVLIFFDEIPICLRGKFGKIDWSVKRFPYFVCIIDMYRFVGSTDIIFRLQADADNKFLFHDSLGGCDFGIVVYI